MMFSSWNAAFRRLLDNPTVRTNRRLRIGVYVLLGIIMYAVLVNSMLPPRYHFVVGQVSPVTITAPTTAEDTSATQAERAAARARIGKQYVMLPSIESSAVNQVRQLFQKAESAVADASLTQAERITQLQAVAPDKLSQSTIQAMLSLHESRLSSLESTSIKIVESLLGSQFNQESLAQAPLLIDRQMLPLNLDRVSQIIVENIVESVLRPNMVYQAALTEANRQEAANQVAPVMIQKGDVIVAQNEAVTPAVISRMKDVGLYSTGLNYKSMAGFLLFMLISVGMLAI